MGGKIRAKHLWFRPGRSCHDAIKAILNALNKKTAFVLDADISKCYDNIDHKALLKKLKTTPTLTKRPPAKEHKESC